MKSMIGYAKYGTWIFLLIAAAFCISCQDAAQRDPLAYDPLAYDCEPFKLNVIQSGQQLSCVISAGQTHQFIVNAHKHHYLTVATTALRDDLDLKMSLETYIDENWEKNIGKGSRIVSGDNSGDGLNPRIQDFQLPITGRYKLIVAASDNSSGPYWIVMDITSSPIGKVSWFTVLLSWISYVLIGVTLLVVVVSLILSKKLRSFFPFTHGDGSPAQEQLSDETQRLEDPHLSSSTSPDISSSDDVILRDVKLGLDNLLRGLGELKENSEVVATVRKQRDDLEARMVEYRNGYNFHVLRNTLATFIDAYEFTNETLKYLSEKPEVEKDAIERYLDATSGLLKQALRDSGVESFAPEPGDIYQTAFGVESVESIPTSDSSRIGKICEIKSAGYASMLPINQAEKEIVRKARVSVYVPKSES